MRSSSIEDGAGAIFALLLTSAPPTVVQHVAYIFLILQINISFWNGEVKTLTPIYFSSLQQGFPHIKPNPTQNL